MVAVYDAVGATGSDVEKYALGGRPVTLVLFSPPSSGETVIDIRSFFSAYSVALDGEPTWEDAAWQ